MSVARDGGPAFPRPIGNNGRPNFEDSEVSNEQAGMSLRDWFAGESLKGAADSICDQLSPEHPTSEAEVRAHVERHARAAFMLADAMLATLARELPQVNDLVDTADELLQAALRMECKICGRAIGRDLPDPDNPCPACDAVRLAVARAEGRLP
jgi:hypothetical protein